MLAIRGGAVLSVVMMMVTAACSGSTAPPTATPAGSPPAASVPSAALPSTSPIPPIADGEPWIVYQGARTTAARSEIRLVRPDGSDDHPLFGDGIPGDDEAHPAWSPDGRSIAIELRFNDLDPQVVVDPPFDFRAEIWVAAVSDRQPRRVATCSLPCLQLAYPAWSPDGRSIAVTRYDIRPDGTWGKSAVEILDVASGARRIVAETADGTTAFYTPRWSPDGREIVAVLESYPDETELELTASQLVIVPTSADPNVVPTTVPVEGFAREPDWSPSQRIVFVVTPDSDYAGTPGDIVTIGPDGGDAAIVFDHHSSDAYAIEPTWEPGGTTIAFTMVDPRRNQEWLAHIAADGTSLRQESWFLRTPRDSPLRAHAHLRP